MADTLTAEQYVALMAKRKPHKYGARAVEVDGIWFPSQREANRWRELRWQVQQGIIADLERQVPYELVMRVLYRADFRYRVVADDTRVVEDAKGARTALYKRKAKLMREQHGITIREV